MSIRLGLYRALARLCFISPSELFPSRSPSLASFVFAGIPLNPLSHPSVEESFFPLPSSSLVNGLLTHIFTARRLETQTPQRMQRTHALYPIFSSWVLAPLSPSVISLPLLLFYFLSLSPVTDQKGQVQ
jgi:hypothetical protein